MDSDEIEYLEKTGDIQKPEKFKDTVDDSEKIDKYENKVPSQRPKHKNDRHDEDLDHHVKRSRNEGGSYSYVRDRNSSLLNRSSSIERERKERQKDRHRLESKNTDMDMEREVISRKERYRDRTKERNRDRGRVREKRDRDCMYEMEKERVQESLSYNRNQSETYQDEWERERYQNKGRSHDMVHKERQRGREVRETNPESRPGGEGIVGFRDDACKKLISELVTLAFSAEELKRKGKKWQKILSEINEQFLLTRWSNEMCLKADERDVYEFFSRAGKVRDVRLIMDCNSRRSKGVGYIEFCDVMSVPVAIALSGQPLLGQPVIVKLSEGEKNLVPFPAAAGLIRHHSGAGRQLYVRNLHLNVREDQLRQIFEPFGTVELVQLPSDPETGHSKGYGFIQFAQLEDARAAQSLDGQLEIAGKVMKVSVVTDQDGFQEAGDFAEDRGDGLSQNDQDQKVLMQKLDCTVTSTSVIGSLGDSPAASPPIAPLGQISIPALAGRPAANIPIPAAIPSINIIGIPSECLLLKNMFDPKVESEPDFDQDIKEDVEGECSNFGDLKHIYVDKNSAGFVYLRFQNSQSSIAAQRALHGRWFSGKMITATFLMPEKYEAKFPNSK